MFIDAHVHIHTNAKLFGEKYDLSPQYLLDCVERSGLDKVVVMPFPSKDFSLEPQNEFVAEFCREHSKKFVGFCTVDPTKGVEAAKLLEKYITTMNFKGLKLHPRFQEFTANDPRIVPVVWKAAELGVPVVIDALLHGPTLLKDNMPLLVDELCRAVPTAKIILAHMGGYRFLDALFVAKVNKTVYLDLSIIVDYFANSPFRDQIEFVIKQVGANRCIYSSDHPSAGDCATTFQKMRGILGGFNLTDEERNWIFAGTIQSLIRFE